MGHLNDRQAVRDGGRFLIVGSCFFLSGFAALLYQVVWQRQFCVVFGTSELAIAAVLASYMAGLAIGAAIAGHWLSRIKRPLELYAALEFAIGICALLVPYVLQTVQRIYIEYAGNQPQPPDANGSIQTLCYTLGSLVVLVVPTALMGATLPLLTQYAIRTRAEIGNRVAALYAINTFGAVVGTIAAAFAIIPWLGLLWTTYFGVAVNFVVALLSIQLARTQRGAAVNDSTLAVDDPTRPEVSSIDDNMPAKSLLLPLMAISGFASFTYEVLWTRLLGHIVGGSNYSFAIMLASFLSGIAIGSSIAAKFAATQRTAIRAFAAAQVGTAILAIGFYASLPWITETASELHGEAVYVSLRAIVLAALTMLPTTLCIGATFPLAVRILSDDAAMASRIAGRVYAWNTVGCILGALGAALWIIPRFEFHGTVVLAVGLNLVCAAAAGILARDFAGRLQAAFSVCIAIFLFVFPPGRPDAVLRASPFADSDRLGPLVYSSVGQSASVVVLDLADRVELRTNGMPEARISRIGSAPLYLQTRLFTMLPWFSRPDARTALYVGLGGGSMIEDLPPTLEKVDVIELESDVVTANRAIGPQREVDPLQDPRVRIVTNDARSALALTNARYDFIISQPSHPWTGGAAHLFTREFLELSRQHLTPSGMYVQWIGLQTVDAENFQRFAATLAEVFPHVKIYTMQSALIFLASGEPFCPERELAALLSDPVTREFCWSVRIYEIEDLLARLAVDAASMQQLCAGIPPITDDHNPFGSIQPAGLAHTLTSKDFDELLENRGVSALADQHAPVYQEIQHPIDRAQLARNLARRRSMALAAIVAESASSPVERYHAHALLMLMQGRDREADQVFEAILEVDPDHQPANFALVAAELESLAHGKAPAKVRDRAARLKNSAHAVVTGTKFRMHSKFEHLQALDDQLAAAEPDDLWFNYAVELRAVWRLEKQVTIQERQRLAREAIVLVDRAINVAPSRILLEYRARAAAIAGMPAELIGSAEAIAADLEAEMQRFPERRSSIAMGGSLLESLKALNLSDSSLSERAQAVRKRIEYLVARVSTVRRPTLR